MNVHQGAPVSLETTRDDRSRIDRLVTLLSEDLDFHGQDSSYASHNFHSFPAKYPPQLPRKFITSLTQPGDAVLDPMMGSGTTLLEAFLLGRHGLGFDIDPLAVLLSRVKVTMLDAAEVMGVARQIVARAREALSRDRQALEAELARRWDKKTRDFVEYWFARETQVALAALIREIDQLPEGPLRAFFELTFSAIIITKSGGVSLALDLAHTRPHRAKVIADETGRVIEGSDLDLGTRASFLTKKLRSPLDEFERRVAQNLEGLPCGESTRLQPYLTGLTEGGSGHPSAGPARTKGQERFPPCVGFGDAQCLPLPSDSVDLIVTSPPYASNAIDYMRAHKFSLVWLGYSIETLGYKRKEYIGGESVLGFAFETLPPHATCVVASVASKDKKKGRVLHRYYSEMRRVLCEMYRVLRPGKAAIVVVGTSVMRGINTETQTCLAEIGQKLGFLVPTIGVRDLDRNRRMMPAGAKLDLKSQIQQRMHQEYVIGFYKPGA